MKFQYSIRLVFFINNLPDFLGIEVAQGTVVVDAENFEKIIFKNQKKVSSLCVYF